MELRYALDTDVWSELLRTRPEPRVRARYDEVRRECALPAPVLHELRHGVALLDAGRRREDLEVGVDRLRRRHPVLSYDADAATWHADQRARLERQGLPRTFVDGQVAAVAVMRSLVLVTRNLKDFGGYDGLQVESWWP